MRRRRIKFLLAVAAAMATLLAMTAAPAMANHNDFFGFGRDNINDFFGFGRDNINDFFGFGRDNFFGNNGLRSDIDQESESGDVSIGFDVSNRGDYASQCTPATQFGNTGNFQNASSFVQYAGELDDFEPEGIDVSFGGSQDVSCPSTIQQSSAASS